MKHNLEQVRILVQKAVEAGAKVDVIPSICVLLLASQAHILTVRLGG